MRWLMWIPIALGCGAEHVPADWVFDVVVSNKTDDCAAVADDVEDEFEESPEAEELCGCFTADDESCSDDVKRSRATYSYEVYIDGDNIAIEIDGQPFASGTAKGYVLDYESPGWLHEGPDGEVQWAVSSFYMRADGTGGESFDDSGHNLLGVEEVEILESDDVNYPVGRTVRYVVTGTAKAVEG